MPQNALVCFRVFGESRFLMVLHLSFNGKKQTLLSLTCNSNPTCTIFFSKNWHLWGEIFNSYLCKTLNRSMRSSICSSFVEWMKVSPIMTSNFCFLLIVSSWNTKLMNYCQICGLTLIPMPIHK